MTRIRVIWLIGMFLTGLPAAAHHSTAGFDKTRTLPITGVVAEFRWINPPAGMLLDVRDSNGTTTRWIVELASPSVLGARGLHRADVKQGDQVTIDGWLSKDGSSRAVGRFVHLPDGRTISGMSAWDCSSAAQEGCAGPFKITRAK